MEDSVGWRDLVYIGLENNPLYAYGGHERYVKMNLG
jgi:hypothetical protein